MQSNRSMADRKPVIDGVHYVTGSRYRKGRLGGIRARACGNGLQYRRTDTTIQPKPHAHPMARVCIVFIALPPALLASCGIPPWQEAAEAVRPQEVLDSRITQMKNSTYFNCRDTVLALYDRNLYRKTGAFAFELLSTKLANGVYTWDLNGEHGEFNPANRVAATRAGPLANRVECTVSKFYDASGRQLATVFPEAETRPVDARIRQASRKTKARHKAKPATDPGSGRPVAEDKAEKIRELEGDANKIVETAQADGAPDSQNTTPEAKTGGEAEKNTGQEQAKGKLESGMDAIMAWFKNLLKKAGLNK